MEQQPLPTQVTATWAGIAKAIVVSTLAAAVLLVVVVLPAEYGVDPLGAGRALGLDVLSGAGELAPVPPPQGDTLAPVREGEVALYPAAYRYDARELTLGPYEYIEFKYRLAEGAAMVFSWTASGDVLHDFHGDREGAPANAAVSFDNRPRREAHGSFDAPFGGIHGWYWENPSGSAIRVRLTTAGFYTEAHEFHYDGSRVARDVRSLDTIGVSQD